ncbi:hypothetical protein T11_17641 [Trichinella zimbabwensis]|uniref:Uncharacterized protein n=1 Tax=Trichinella zimbabwensis TaxID=268475 RepID=A0A0V1G6Z3_9BILA|nr:hypothetical protein T11_17641 [Trichinella zimbabwensis]
MQYAEPYKMKTEENNLLTENCAKFCYKSLR